jgi:hypothetical protein
MQDYHKQKKNPDPAIAKILNKKSIPLSVKKDDIDNQPKEFELPKLNEIPEVKDSEPVMEIL